jgi:hypothetical protein
MLEPVDQVSGRFLSARGVLVPRVEILKILDGFSDGIGTDEIEHLLDRFPVSGLPWGLALDLGRILLRQPRKNKYKRKPIGPQEAA